MGRAFIGNFKGPKGDKGETGAAGPQGIQGPAGPTGAVDANTPVDFTEAPALENIESGESLSTIFGKIKKIAGSLLIGAGSTLLGQNLTAARALVSDVNGKVGVSTITAAELGYLAGLTKNAQTQFNELNENIAKKQDASTAITTGNIGQQSVKYATTAGSATTASAANAVEWGNVSGKPNTFAPSSHTHDDRYYTETEVNNLIWNEVQVKDYSVDNLTVPTGTKTQEFSIAQSGYWTVGLVQVSIENASTNGTSSSQCSIYGYGTYSQSAAFVRIRAWADAKIKITIKVLYWKDPR